VARSDTTYPEIVDDVEPRMQHPIRLQAQLGWTQLYHGRMSKNWAHAIDLIHPKLPIAGEQIMTTFLKDIWSYFLAIWAVRNTHLHNTTAQLDLPNYHQAVVTLYEQKHKISPIAQAVLYRQPLNELLEQPVPRLQQWATRGYRYFTQQMKAECKWATMNTPDI